ncbi:methyltransferase [Yamadazyma tenuis]|uniref:tRNA N(3)-methylcytidine methyltransferase n=1 Tax=Candida tenuis (strain ATCC 10573 / BCRC 21748 / CBS 615 / JCM 9827 / NBRC 10315 / NRRL Y-1498 / VKM Y-70) TaxID=590646 RepID=G3B7B3_CANTC|nr:methyltransferase [Yamadazyma tenuis ATCC 10573]EGV61612.1 methyltransferase [Yamadazyma tenuis ATCC 10573]WEJ92835.1 methyltransferase [Yamadazyma tenuis]
MTIGENTPKETKPPLDTRIGKDSPFTFGQRFLENEEEVFNHNAWDHVEWGPEQIEQCQKLIEVQYENPVKDFDKKLYNSNPAKYWDIFYKHNRENFFKDRKWLQIEFPSLFKFTSEDYQEKTSILEIGCGAGNTFFPILEQNKNPNLKIFGCDYSKVAVDLVRSNSAFKENSELGIAYSSVWDVANVQGEIPEDLEQNSCDVIIMVFIFSALHPDQWEQAISNLKKCLKPGGQILFRDYGRYDLAQVRFKKNRLLQDNFYIRGDGTRVYFFTEEELREIFTVTGPFKELQIATDRRLLVNRKKQLKMYRNWLQAVFTIDS